MHPVWAILVRGVKEAVFQFADKFKLLQVAPTTTSPATSVHRLVEVANTSKGLKAFNQPLFLKLTV